MPVDPSIPLSVDPSATAGPDIGKLIAAKNMLLQMQQRQQAQQQQNALLSLYRQPGAIDPATGMPTQQTATATWGIDPSTGLALTEARTQQQAKQAQLTQAQQQIAMNQQGMIQDQVRDPALNAYDDALKTHPEPQAREIAQRVYNEGLDSLKKSGAFSEQDQARFPPNFDPTQVRARALSYKERVAQQEKEEADKRAAAQLKVSQGELSVAEARERREAGGLALTDEGKKEAALNYISTGQLPTGASNKDRASIIDAAADLRKSGAVAPKNLDKPVTVEIDDGKGGTRQLLAQQDATTSKWYSADGNLTPLDAKNIRIVKADATGGGRAQVMVQRQLVDAKDATSEIKNIMDLPISTDTGWFGGRKQGPNLLDAAKEVLTNKVTAQEVQDYNANSVGLGRALAGLETGGLQVNQGLMENFEKLQLKEGDTYLTKLRKMAIMRQQAENALETALTNPIMGKKESELASKLIDQLHEAVPFTVQDVNALERSDDQKMSIGDFAKKTGLGGGEQVTQSFPVAPADKDKPDGNIKYDAKGYAYRKEGDVYKLMK